jgi:hypothetical protein
LHRVRVGRQDHFIRAHRAVQGADAHLLTGGVDAFDRRLFINDAALLPDHTG